MPTHRRERVFIGLGSNLAEPIRQIERALTALAGVSDSRLLRRSRLYRSRPLGPQNQPDYLNAVAEMETALSPLVLLDHLQAIERAQGRQRGERWGARTLDLDLLLYGQAQLHHGRLQVPHGGLYARNFVLYPLAELVAEDYRLPTGQPLRDLLQHCSVEGLQVLDESERR